MPDIWVGRFRDRTHVTQLIWLMRHLDPLRNLNREHFDVVKWFVGLVDARLLNRVNDVKSTSCATEDAVLVVEPGRRHSRNEKLTAVGFRASIRHAKRVRTEKIGEDDVRRCGHMRQCPDFDRQRTGRVVSSGQTRRRTACPRWSRHLCRRRAGRPFAASVIAEEVLQ